MIPLDKFISTSGKYTVMLASEGSMAYVAILSGGRVRKIVRLGAGAGAFWDDLKERLTAPAQEEEPTLLEEAELNTLHLKEFYFNDELIGYVTIGETAMKTEVIGSRILVKPIIPVDEVSARLKAVGIEPVIAEVNKPKPTMGVIVGLGEDPLIQEKFSLGDIVIFGKYAGDGIMEDGVEFRALGHHEIIGRRSSEAAPSNSPGGELGGPDRTSLADKADRPSSTDVA